MNPESKLPPYPMEQVLAAPFPERVRLVCRSWAAQVAPNQPVVMALYWTKYLFVYVGGWAAFCAFNTGYPGFTSPVEWAFSAAAFQKMIVWSIFYELLGLGCSWGPLNARFKPMTGGFRYFLRPGTTKLPLFPGVPIIGNPLRNWLDVALYSANQLFLLRVLVAPELTPELLMPAFVLLPLLGVLDKTLFLAARAEHYYVVLVCFVVAGADVLWISGSKMVWCFIWFWAATSKLNSHFPSVIMFMMNNGPFFPKFLKKRLFRSYLDDLRPSRLAGFIAHIGTAIEYMIPVLLLLSPNATTTTLFLCLMASFHTFIALNNPNGMPIEWNILMIYGAIFLFGVHPEASVLALGQAPWLLAFLVVSLVGVPLLGNFFPSRVSFLLSMRYYAGNWAYNIWLFRKGGSLEKLDRLKKSAGTMAEQLAQLGLDEETANLANTMVMASRFMHFEGRPLLEMLPKAVNDIENYEWIEGEVFGGSIIGWNFGDGHLNGKLLLDAIQPQCQFEEGEVRLLSIESQPLFKPTMEWKIYDAATGLIEEGTTDLKRMRDQQPWPTGEFAEALRP
ncbi:MAG: DUF3556 domain-containing protein [Deltaproteobacteria bacterium]|nr:DUF3556 domain-containing protein [Deltaproteobacteria bacterium]